MEDLVLGILAFFIVLIPLVIIHEFGHFLAAKSVGITVLEFGIGIPPRAAKLFTSGETEYTLNWIPLGGFVRPYGEDFVRPKDDEEMTADRAEIERRGIENPKSVFEAGPWERIWFMAAGPIANFIAAFAIFVIIAMTGQPYQVFDVEVVSVLDESAAATATSVETGEPAPLQAGDVIKAVNGEEIESVSEFEDEIEDQERYTLTVARANGETEDVTIMQAEAVESDVEEWVRVTGVYADSPAHEAGIKEDDVVVSVQVVPEEGTEVEPDNSENPRRTVKDVEWLSDFTAEHGGQVVRFEIWRSGESDSVFFDIVPENLDISTSDDPMIGIGIDRAPLNQEFGAVVANQNESIETVPADNVLEGLEIGATRFAQVSVLIVRAPIDIISGVIPLEQARPASPVAISQFGGEFIRESQEQEAAFPILSFTALISIALAVTNLLPIPGLDGGRILFVIIELLRGKPMAPEREGFVHMMGLLFLFSIIIVAVIMDIVAPFDTSVVR
jgi:regulator of sigma E protease